MHEDLIRHLALQDLIKKHPDFRLLFRDLGDLPLEELRALTYHYYPHLRPRAGGRKSDLDRADDRPSRWSEEQHARFAAAVLRRRKADVYHVLENDGRLQTFEGVDAAGAHLRLSPSTLRNYLSRGRGFFRTQSGPERWVSTKLDLIQQWRTDLFPHLT